MKLRSVVIRRMPGIHQPFRLEPGDLGPGLNLVVGPNAVGKSSLCRAVRALLWPSVEPDLELDAEAAWEIDGEVVTVSAVPGRPVRWTAGGRACAPPDLPPGYLARCYAIGLLEVVKPDAAGATDERLQAELRRQLSGGYDLKRVERPFYDKPQAGRAEARALRAAEQKVRELAGRLEALARDEEGLEALRRERDEASRARGRLERLRVALQVAGHRQVLREARAEADRRFPPQMDRLRGDERESLDALREECGEVERKLREARATLRQAEEEMAACGLGDDPPSVEALEEARARVQNLLRVEDTLDGLAQERAAARGVLEQARAALGEAFDPAAAGRVDAAFLETLDRLMARRDEARTRLDQAEQFFRSTRSGPGWLPGLLVALAAGALSCALAWGATSPVGMLGLVAGTGLGAAAVVFSLRYLAQRRAGRLLEQSREAWEAADDEVRRFKRGLGLDLPDGSLALGSLAGDLRRWQEARAELARLESRREEIQRRHEAWLEEIATFVARWSRMEVRDGAGAQAAVGALVSRAERHRQALARCREASRRADDLEQRLARLRAGCRALFERAGLPDIEDLAAADRALDERLALLSDYREVTARCARLEWAIREKLAELGDQASLAERSPDQLEEEAARLEGQVSRLDALQQQVADTEARVRQARESHAMARALEARDEARRDLEQALAGQLVRAAGRVLMRRVRERHARDAEPRVLARAASLLATFTRQAYALEAEPETGAFRVRDALSGETLLLAALSDGTRSQVLLAARLAFAFEAEGKARPPLWLDEALTGADPERFAAVADSLVEMLRREDRQVFYLTASPSDVEIWQQALEHRGEARVTPIDLGRLRRGQATAAVRWVPAEPRPIPDPGGMDPGAFAAEVGVGPVDPWADVEALHLFYLLADDLPTLARLLEAGIETAGQWKVYRLRGAATLIVPEKPVAARIDAAVAAASSFYRAFRQGRPRPLARRDLLATGILSQTFFEPVAALATRLDGDGARLIEALRGRAVKGFHRATADKLEQAFRERGLIDEDEALDRGQVTARVLADSRPFIENGSIDVAGVRAVVDTLWRHVIPALG
ncbi:MAG: hypothetical protein Q9Q13_08560 [Acidobacteriota bacterium]|nr:hypothetical protein [Acidobacteriota bacterium]